MICKAVFTSVDIDNTYNNVLRFNNRDEQKAYFDLNTLFSTSSVDVNVDFNDLLNVTITATGESVLGMLTKNYVIVEVKEKDKPTTYLYYFINNVKYEAGTRVRYICELDIFNTYYLDIEFKDCVINRAHLNRFVIITADKMEFEQDKMLISEGLGEPQKLLKRREPLRIMPFNTAIDEWARKYVSYWVYYFIDRSKKYKVLNIQGAQQSELADGVTAVDYAYDGIQKRADFGVVCYPVLKDGAQILVKSKDGGSTINIMESAINNFLTTNNVDSGTYLYNIKLSEIPPFDDFLWGVDDYNINDNVLTITATTTADSTTNKLALRDRKNDGLGTKVIKTASGTDRGLFTSARFYNTYYDTTYANAVLPHKDFEFGRPTGLGARRNYNLNPKLNSTEVLELQIKSINGEAFACDLQKINSRDINFAYSELIAPEITKAYLRLNTYNRLGVGVGVYPEEAMFDSVGLITSNDTSLPVVSTKYNEFVANNKNFWLQTVGKSALDLGGMLGAKSRDKIDTTINTGASLIDTGLNMGNMKNAPDSLQNAQGNIQFNLICSGQDTLCNYLELWEAPPADIQARDDYMYNFGYVYNQLDNIKNVDNLRLIFNFVQAQVDEISTTNEYLSLPNNIKNKFIEVFARGVRMWNADSELIFNYEYENWERGVIKNA